MKKYSLAFLFVRLSLGFSALLAQPCTGWSIADIDVSQQHILRVHYDNDAFAGTDRFYTQGFRVDYITPRFKDLLLARFLLFRLGKRPTTYYGLSLAHGTFTPDNIESEEIVEGDRPYARHLTFRHFLISNDLKRKLRLTTAFDVGFLGPLSTFGLLKGGGLGSDGPKGWDHQIKSDVIVSYLAVLEKGVVSNDFFDLLGQARVNLSTLDPHVGAGVMLRFGALNPYFYELHFTPRSLYGQRDIRNMQFFVDVLAEARYKFYDATLQGGMLNGSSPYVIESGEVENLVPQITLGLNVIIKRIGLRYAHTFQAAEFSGAEGHSWGRISLIWHLK